MSCPDLATKQDIEDIKNLLSGLDSKLTSIDNRLSVIENKVDNFSSVLNNAIDSIENLIVNLIDDITGLINNAISAIQATIQSLIDLIRDLFGVGNGDIEALLQEILGAVNSNTTAIGVVRQIVEAETSEIDTLLRSNFERVLNLLNTILNCIDCSDANIQDVIREINENETLIRQVLAKTEPWDWLGLLNLIGQIIDLLRKQEAVDCNLDGVLENINRVYNLVEGGFGGIFSLLRSVEINTLQAISTVQQTVVSQSQALLTEVSYIENVIDNSIDSVNNNVNNISNQITNLENNYNNLDNSIDNIYNTIINQGNDGNDNQTFISGNFICSNNNAIFYQGYGFLGILELIKALSEFIRCELNIPLEDKLICEDGTEIDFTGTTVNMSPSAVKAIANYINCSVEKSNCASEIRTYKAVYPYDYHLSIDWYDTDNIKSRYPDTIVAGINHELNWVNIWENQLKTFSFTKGNTHGYIPLRDYSTPVMSGNYVDNNEANRVLSFFIQFLNSSTASQVVYDDNGNCTRLANGATKRRISNRVLKIQRLLVVNTLTNDVLFCFKNKPIKETPE